VPQRQLNIRLDDQDYERLEVAAFVHRRSIADELRAALNGWLDKAENESRFADASRSRDPLPEADAAKSNVSSLAIQRKRSRGKET
jgi:plasmid stability protein